MSLNAWRDELGVQIVPGDVKMGVKIVKSTPMDPLRPKLVGDRLDGNASCGTGPFNFLIGD